MFKSLWTRNGSNPETLVSDLQTQTIDFPNDARLGFDISIKTFHGRRLDGYVLAELEIASRRTNPIAKDMRLTRHDRAEFVIND